MAVKYEQTVESAIEECSFAKQVETATGSALMINGSVIEFKCQNSDFWVEVVSRALRRGGRATSGETVTEFQATHAGVA